MGDVCAAIEQDVDRLLQFLGTLTPSPFPPGFFDRNLTTSASFFVWLASFGALVVMLFLLWIIPRCLARRRYKAGYERVVDREVGRLRMRSFVFHPTLFLASR
jgi:hypothetical protein